MSHQGIRQRYTPDQKGTVKSGTNAVFPSLPSGYPGVPVYHLERESGVGVPGVSAQQQEGKVEPEMNRVQSDWEQC